MKAVRFDQYGDRDVLYIAEIEAPEPGPGEVLVEVRAAGINPGEASIRTGFLQERWPSTFPSGEGTDLAGVVTAIGTGVSEFDVGDEVLGWSWTRSSHAEFATVPVTQLVTKPAALSWEVAGSLNVAGATAWAAVDAVDPKPGEAVVVSAAAGGVGSIAVQLLGIRGADVIGIASAANHAWLRERDVTPVAYGDGLERRVRDAAPDGVDALIDTFGPEYLDLAVALGVAPERINTIIAFERAAQIGAKTAGSVDGSTQQAMAALAELAASGRLAVPIAATYPLARVQDAFAELEQRHTRGKIVLIP
ncbi:MAG TPA: NADP-dependent oxidoreductase [Solirubrobacteraceae bacterium]|jgi:NADPH:quinone reductase-like Zn-dependent oxidoreductase|nr:NADP-dependent oxidoreductase [Solirubrobacteraceae bacterium]